MYKVSAGLYAIEETITRPVLIQVTDGIKTFLGLTNDIYTVYDPKDDNYKRKNKLGKITGQTNSYDEVVKIEYQDLNEDEVDVSLQIVNPDYDGVYSDPEIGAMAVPVYQRRKINLTFNYSTKSKSKIHMLVNKLRLMTARNSMYKTHNLEYSFILPEFFKKLLLHIVTLKNIYNTTPLAFEDYLNSTFDTRLDTLNTMDGYAYKSDIVIKERQQAVIGYIIDDLQNINAEFDETSGMWFLSFTYEFTYEKPLELMMKYPLLVYNTMIDAEFRTFIQENGTPDVGVRTKGTAPIYDIAVRHSSAFTLLKSKYYISIPAEDPCIMPKPPSFMALILSILILVDNNNPTSLFNIKTDLPNIVFKDNVITLLLEYFKDHINTMYGSIIYFELYENCKKIDSNPLIIDNDGNLTTTYPMNIKNSYHVNINVVTDLTVLNPEAKAIFKQFLLDEMALLNLNLSEYASFLEYYIELLSIQTEVLVDGIIRYGYQDAMFNIVGPRSVSYFTKEVLINVAGFMNETITAIDAGIPM